MFSFVGVPMVQVAFFPAVCSEFPRAINFCFIKVIAVRQLFLSTLIYIDWFMKQDSVNHDHTTCFYYGYTKNNEINPNNSCLPMLFVLFDLVIFCNQKLNKTASPFLGWCLFVSLCKHRKFPLQLANQPTDRTKRHRPQPTHRNADDRRTSAR